MTPHILFILPLPPPVHGAAVVSQQIKSSKLINDSFQCDFINSATSRAVDDVGHFRLVKLFRYVSIVSLILTKLITGDHDLCYLAITCHGKGFLKDAPFVLLCKLFRKKIVIHQHNKGMSNDLDRWPYRWLMPLCYSNAKVILLSWLLYPDVEKVVPRMNVMICPNGISIRGIHAPYLEHENTIPRLLFLSNLIESKGVIILLDALKILLQSGYMFRCDFVGGETKEIDARRFAVEVDKRQMDHIAFYLGKKFGEEKERIFDEADIFVFPTSNDCFPLVLLEAMAHRLPIVTTEEGGIPDLVEDGKNGLICKRKDPESLADCIAKLLDNAILRVRMGEDGYRRLKDRYTEQHFERRFMECLSDFM